MNELGPLIERARIAAGLSPEDLGEAMGKKKGIHYRMLSGQEPSAEQINILIEKLPLSAETILIAMGVRLNPPEARKLPTRLVAHLMAMGPEGWESLIRTFDSVAASRDRT